MRVLLIPFRYFDNPIGGLETSLRHIIANLKAKGHYVTVIATSFDWKEYFYKIDGIEIYKLPFWNHIHFLMKNDPPFPRLHLREIVQFPYAIFRMWVIFLKKKPDIVNMHYAGPQSAVILILSYVMKFKFILTLHGFGTQQLSYPGVFKWSKVLFKKLLKRADVITAPSNNLIEDAIHWEPSIKQKCKLIPNGIDTDEFMLDRRITNNIDSINPIREPKYHIYSDYRYWPNKDYGLLLFAYKAILESGYDVDLALSVVDSEKWRYYQVLCLLGLEQSVKIIDHKSPIDKEIFLKGSDCYISLSKSSFCDFKALEALSSRKSVIADRMNDIRKIKAEHDDVLLIDTSKESEIISALENLLDEQKDILEGKVSPRFKEILLGKNNIATPYILTVCNLCRYKGVSTLIKAFKKISQEYPELNLVIAGGGGQRWTLERFSERIGLKHRIIFLGAATREEVIRLFKGCEFFVLPSWIEPFGIVNLEAMAAGKAVIATNVDGIPEIVKNNANAILVKPRDSNALAEAIKKLLEDKELRERFGKKGREMAEDPRFSWARITDEYVKAYEDVLCK